MCELQICYILITVKVKKLHKQHFNLIAFPWASMLLDIPKVLHVHVNKIVCTVKGLLEK